MTSRIIRRLGKNRCVRADRKEPLIVLPLRLATEVAAVAEGHKTGDCYLGPAPQLIGEA